MLRDAVSVQKEKDSQDRGKWRGGGKESIGTGLVVKSPQSKMYGILRMRNV